MCDLKIKGGHNLLHENNRDFDSKDRPGKEQYDPCHIVERDPSQKMNDWVAVPNVAEIEFVGLLMVRPVLLGGHHQTILL